MSSGRTILRNFASMTFGKSAGDFFTFLFFIVLAKAFGQHGIGVYSLAMAVTGFMMIAADFGLFQYSIKTISRQVGATQIDYGGIFAIRLVLSIAVFGLLLAGAMVAPLDPQTRAVILLLGAYHAAYPMLRGLVSILVSHEHMRLSATLDFLQRFGIAVVGMTIVALGGGLVAAVAAYPAVTVLFLLAVYVFIAARYGAPPLHARLSVMIATLRGALPFAMSAGSSYLGSRMDILLLGVLLGAAAAGTYNVAYRFIFIITVVPQFAGLALLPLTSRLHLGSREKLAALYHRSLNMAVLAWLPAAGGLWLVAPALIELVFGPQFAESALILRILAGVVFLSGLREIMSVFLIASDRENGRAKAQFFMVVTSTVGNLLLIPAIGIPGAAVATLLAQTVLVLLFAMRLRGLLGWPRIGVRLAIAGTATLAFCVPLSLASPLPLFLTVPIAIAIYGIVLLLFPSVRASEARLPIAWIRGARTTPAE